MRTDACRRFIGVFSPYAFKTKPVTNMSVMHKNIPAADFSSPNEIARMAGPINKRPANCRIKPRLPHIGL